MVGRGYQGNGTKTIIMGVRLVRNAGLEMSPAMLDVYASGVVQRNSVVEFSRTGGAGVIPATSSSTTTGIFGVCLDYAQGASDVIVKVIPFVPGQIWEIDCVNSATTAQIGLRHGLSDNLNLRNTATDAQPVSTTNGAIAVFHALAMRGLTTGSGILIGRFRTSDGVVFPSQTTYTAN